MFHLVCAACGHTFLGRTPRPPSGGCGACRLCGGALLPRSGAPGPAAWRCACASCVATPC